MANPYAPPGFDDGGFVPPTGGASPGTPLPWEVGEVVKISWEIIKRQPILVVVVFGVYLVQNLPSIAVNVLQALRLFEPDSWAFLGVAVAASVVAFVISLFLQIGQLKMFVAAARGQQADFSLLLSGADRVLHLLVLGILMGLAILVGALGLCVGAFVVACGLTLSQYYLIDARQGIIESLQTSWRVTTGNRLNLFLFFVVAFAMSLLGLCAACVGLFVAWAIFQAGLAVIYLRSAGEAVMVGAPPPAAGPPPPAYSPQGMA